MDQFQCLDLCENLSGLKAMTTLSATRAMMEEDRNYNVLSFKYKRGH